MRGVPEYALRIRSLHDKGDYDPDVLIFHAAFEALAQFVDDVKEMGGERYQKDYKHAVKILSWFQDKWTQREKFTVAGEPLPKRPGGKKHFNLDKVETAKDGTKHHTIFISKELKAYMRLKIASDLKWRGLEDKMLGEIIKMRRSLWA